MFVLLFCLLLLLGLIACSGTNAPVLTCGDTTLSSTEFSYYYWSEFFYHRDAYGNYLSGLVDFSKPLDQQAYSEEQTWQDYLIDEALSVAKDTIAMSLAAEDTGFVLPADYDRLLTATWDQFLQQAEGDPDGYLQESYGSDATVESFRLYLYRSHLASAYAESLYQTLDPSADEISAYYQAHAGDYLDNYGLSETDDWESLAREHLLQEMAQEQLQEILNRYTFQINHNAVNIVPPAGLYEET